MTEIKCRRTHFVYTSVTGATFNAISDVELSLARLSRPVNGIDQFDLPFFEALKQEVEKTGEEFDLSRLTSTVSEVTRCLSS